MLSVRGLGKSFGDAESPVRVIDDVSFDIAAGDCYALLGPSGCGKTTTLRCIAGLEQPDAGTISIDGRVVNDAATGVFVPPHERSIGMVFQSYAIWPHLDVFENVAYPLRVRRLRPPNSEVAARVGEMLALVGMGALARRAASELSGGQQQRVALARALVRRPALLLLDEPLSNLDARLREQTRNELRQMIAKVGITALFVTHDQAEAFAISDRVAVMSQGHIVQEGTPRAIYARPGSTFVAIFLGAANVLSARVAEPASDGGARVVLEDAPQASIVVRSEFALATGERVEVVVRPEDIDVRSAPPADAAPGLRGTTEFASFQGNAVECGVRVGDALVRATLHGAQELRPGAEVWLCLDPSRCLVFRKEA